MLTYTKFSFIFCSITWKGNSLRHLRKEKLTNQSKLKAFSLSFFLKCMCRCMRVRVRIFVYVCILNIMFFSSTLFLTHSIYIYMAVCWCALVWLCVKFEKLLSFLSSINVFRLGKQKSVRKYRTHLPIHEHHRFNSICRLLFLMFFHRRFVFLFSFCFFFLFLIVFVLCTRLLL